MTTKGSLLALLLVATGALSACCCATNEAERTKIDYPNDPELANDAVVQSCGAALRKRGIDPATKTFFSTPGFPHIGITSEELARLKQKYPQDDLITCTYAPKVRGVGGAGVFVMRKNSHEIVWMALGR